MVDSANLSKINVLYNEVNKIHRAFDLLDQGGQIIEMTIGKASEEEPIFWQFRESVSTENMEYPAQMVEAIRAYLNQRLDAINNELTDLGVTGLAAGGRMSNGKRKRQHRNRRDANTAHR